jgi:hypothetical protein
MKKAVFLEEMEQVVPWAKLCALIEAHYPKPGNRRQPKELAQRHMNQQFATSVKAVRRS